LQPSDTSGTHKEALKPLFFFFVFMRLFRNKITKEIFRVKDSEDKIIKALEFNEGFEELYEI